MTSHEAPASLFGKGSYIANEFGMEFNRNKLVVDPEQLSGFDTEIMSLNVVAGILEITMDGMRNHGASALGLDLDSLFGRIHASGHIEAAFDVGASILDGYAPRNDDTTWHEWIKAEFPNAIAALYGEDSDIVEIARQEMSR